MGLEIIMRSLAQTTAVVEVNGIKTEGAQTKDFPQLCWGQQ